MSLAAMRSRRPPVPGADSPTAQVLDYLMATRSQIEDAAARMPVPRRAVTRPLDGPVRGLTVVDDRALVRDGDDEVMSTDRVLLHLHGGAYCLGSAATDRGLAGVLSRTALAAVVMPEYRLAPEDAFPAGLDDVHATYRWLVDDRGVAASRVALSGASAGGGLGAALLVRLRDEGSQLPACFVAMSPWMDLAATGKTIVSLAHKDPWLPADLVRPAGELYAGAAPLDDPLISPLYADLTGLPPMLVHVGGDEILLDDAERFVAAARRHGVDASLGRFEGLWHVFQLVPGLPESRDAIREIGGFVRRHTSSPW